MEDHDTEYRHFKYRPYVVVIKVASDANAEVIGLISTKMLRSRVVGI